MEMVRIGVVPKPPSDDEGIERPRKKSKKSSVDTCNLMINQEQERHVGCDVREKEWMEWMMFIRWNVTNGTT
ncbi:hypothetical protein Tco_1442120, partial [Tanacetum coccineum]